jgi:hypothetical protein
MSIVSNQSMPNSQENDLFLSAVHVVVTRCSEAEFYASWWDKLYF